MTKHLLIVLVISLLVSIPLPQQAHPSEHMTLADDSAFQLSYTSRDRHGITIIENGNTIWGDHVLVNATYLLTAENITASTLIIVSNEGENYTIISDNHTVIYDTYQIGKNITASIDFQVTFENGTQKSYLYTSIGIANLFRPYLYSLDVTGAGVVKKLGWSITDLNSDDNHLFDVYIRRNGTLRWWLLAENITEAIINWDTSLYSHGSWYFRVVVRDNDTVFRPSAFSNSTLWPALLNSLDSALFPIGPITDTFGSVPGANVTIEPEGVIVRNHIQGDTTSNIGWIKHVSMFDAHPDLSESKYYLYKNGTLSETANITYGYIWLDIAFLSLGVYNFTLYVTHKGHSAIGTIIVRVLPRASSIADNPVLLPTIMILAIALFGFAFYMIWNSKKL